MIKKLFKEVNQNLNTLYYKSNTINQIIEARKKLKDSIENLENEYKKIGQATKVNCTARQCINYSNGLCKCNVITMEDIEETENIKFKEIDFMVCKNLKLKEY